MRARRAPTRTFLVAVLLALGIAGPARAAQMWAVTDANPPQLFRFNTATPGSPEPLRQITGLQMSETILVIDRRPEDNKLYALGSTGRLYRIDPFSAAATALPNVSVPVGTRFGGDFNPAADYLRVVSDADQNVRLNADDGTVAGTDGTLAYGPGDANFGANPNVVGAAYTNNFLGATSTTLYGIDSTLDVLVIQDLPNPEIVRTVGSLGADFSERTASEILDDQTLWVTTVRLSSTDIYTVDLSTGQANPRGTVPRVITAMTGEPTGAAGPFTGELVRLAGNQLRFDVTNGGRPIEFLNFELADGFEVNEVGITSGPQAACNPFSGTPAARCGPFDDPGWGRERLQILITPNGFYPSNGGAMLYVCPRPCAPFFADFGPISFSGPVPPTDGAPNGGGAPSGGSGPTGGGFEGVRVFDIADTPDVVVIRDARGTPKVVRFTAQAPEGLPPADALDYMNWRITFGSTAGPTASQRRRAATLVNTRRKVTLRGGQRKRVRLPLTKAGRRFIRRYERRRLRVTMRFTVRHRPATGAPKTRSIRRNETLTIQRKRR